MTPSQPYAESLRTLIPALPLLALSCNAEGPASPCLQPLQNYSQAVAVAYGIATCCFEPELGIENCTMVEVLGGREGGGSRSGNESREDTPLSPLGPGLEGCRGKPALTWWPRCLSGKPRPDTPRTGSFLRIPWAGRNWDCWCLLYIWCQLGPLREAHSGSGLAGGQQGRGGNSPSCRQVQASSPPGLAAPLPPWNTLSSMGTTDGSSARSPTPCLRPLLLPALGLVHFFLPVPMGGLILRPRPLSCVEKDIKSVSSPPVVTLSFAHP